MLVEAGVTRATMYRHFAGKEALVTAYLEAEDASLRGQFAAACALRAAAPPSCSGGSSTPLPTTSRGYHTRGCPFINAAAEFPDPGSPVRLIVARHRTWFRATLAELTRTAELPDPDAAAAALVLLRDAALVGGYLDGVDVTAPAFVATARQVVGLEHDGTVGCRGHSRRRRLRARRPWARPCARRR